jgi:putative tricarboxylic transport membrane protein
VIFSSALLMCFVGVAMATNGLFGITVMLLFAVFGLLLHSFGYSMVIFIIAFFLGPQFEKSLAQAIALLNGNLLNIYTSPVAVALLALSVAAVYWFLSKRNNTVS